MSEDDFTLDYGDPEKPMRSEDNERSVQIRELATKKDELAKMKQWDRNFIEDLAMRKPRKFSRAQRREIDRIVKEWEASR